MKLAAECPRCGLGAQQDVYPAGRAPYLRMAPERVVGRVQCWNCGVRYYLRAAAFQEAREKAA